MARICSVDGCGKKHYGKGFCKKHYDRWYRHGNPLHVLTYEETRRKRSEAQKGKKRSETTKKKISEASKGRKHSEASKKKISESHKGRKHSEASKKKMSEARKGRFGGEKHPMYGKHQSIEAKRKNAEAHKGKKLSESHKKKISEANKNPSEEIRKKRSEASKGRKHSEASKKKMSEARLGTKLSEVTKKKISTAKKGTKASEVTKKKMSEAMKGKKHTEESKRKMSESAKGKIISIEQRKKASFNAHKWLKEHPEFRKQASERRAKQKFPFKDSKPELLVQSILKKYGVSFKKHHSFKLSDSYHQADIVIDPDKVIEIFGDYWHFNPKKYDGESIQKKKRKEIKAKEVWKYDEYVIDGMKNQGYKVLVVWESELKDELEKTTKKILKFAKT